MSAESLEDGEIASEHEPSPAPGESDVDDELVIDQIIEDENNQSTSQGIINSPEQQQEKPRRQRNKRGKSKGQTDRSIARYEKYQQKNQPLPPSLMATSWHTINGNGNTNGHSDGGGGHHRQMRQPPSESVIFGITPTPGLDFLQPPPPINQQMMVSPDITRLQNIVNHQRDYYPPPPGIILPPRVPYHFFQSPHDLPHHHQMRTTTTPLMSIPIAQQQQQRAPYLAPPPPPQMLQNLSSPANLQPTTSNTSSSSAAAKKNLNNTTWRTSDNYEQIAMEMSPEEPPPVLHDSWVRPPAQIPLEAVVTSSTSSRTPPQQQKKKKSPEVVVPTKNPPVAEDEAALRAFLLANMNPGGKRPTSSAGAATSSSSGTEAKRVRRNSATRLSSSVEQVFGAKPVQPPPPVPKIQVNIAKDALSVVAPASASAPESESAKPAAAPEVPAAAVMKATPSTDVVLNQKCQKQPEEEEVPREQKREQLEKRMQEIEAAFQAQRDKLSDAGKNSKVAATMAAKAEELAKQAERMNQDAVELRQKCIEDTRAGKEEMKRILIEKRELQTAIDEMSIDDIEEIDVDEFPCIFFASVKRDSIAPKTAEPEDEKPGSLQLSPPPPPPLVAQNGDAPEARAPAPPALPTLNSTAPKDPRAPAPTRAPSKAQASPSAPPDASRTLNSSSRILSSPSAPSATPRAQDASPRAPVLQKERQEGGRNETRRIEEQYIREEISIDDEEEITIDEWENSIDERANDQGTFGAVVGGEEEMDMEVEEADEEEEEIEGEDEYETDVEVVEDVAVETETAVTPSPPPKPSSSTSKEPREVPPLNKKIEEEMRARLLNKFSKNDTTRKSPDAEKVTSSSSTTSSALSQQSLEDRAAECRAVLLRMCKFELNGKCERPRDCHFLHMHNINDTKQQTQILEGLFRDVFEYQEADLDVAVAQTMHFLPEFRAFERLMDQFFKVVITRTPDYKSRLFNFFAQVRR